MARKKWYLRCELCGEFVRDMDYFSLPDCNETGFGVCICPKCNAKLPDESKVEEE